MTGAPDIDRARDYPYHIPRYSYLLDCTGYRKLPTGAPLPDLTGRHPVIACGSNQSPEQLRRKFDFSDGTTIPVLRTRIDDFDSVYSPHFSRYGAIAATLHHSPGVSVILFTTWLTDHQLETMHATEALGLNYDYARLGGLRLTIEGDARQPRNEAFAYIGRRGALSLNNQPIALAEIPAEGRKGPALTQAQAQGLARDRLSPGVDLDRFIGENIEREELRHQRTRRLAANAIPFFYDRCQRLPVER